MQDYHVIALIAGMFRAADLAAQEQRASPVQYVKDAEKLLRLAREGATATPGPVQDDAASPMRYDRPVPPYAVVIAVNDYLNQAHVLDLNKVFWARHEERKGLTRYDGRFSLRASPTGVDNPPPDATHVVVFR